MGVLALQGDVAEHRGALSSIGAESSAVLRPEDLEGLGGIVIPGGESTTMSMLLESSGLFEPLRAAIKGGLPAFGTCAGMIMLADKVEGGRSDQKSLAGIDIAVRRNAFGRQLQSFECDLHVDALGDEAFPAVFIRAPLVEKVGPGVEVLAAVSTPDVSRSRPVLCRQGSVVVSSFHPELTTDTRLHRLFISIVEQGGS